jgi:hypothetical protein
VKYYLSICTLLLLCNLSLSAQESAPSTLVNTLKERITLSGYAQTGYTYNDAERSNTFDVKRIIFMAEGKITDRLLCYFMYDFANSGNLLEVYAEYRFRPELKVRLGQFKTMFSFENPMSPCNTELINCYSQAVSYLAGVTGSDPLYGAQSGRDFGLLLYGDAFSNLLSYQLAVMNGQGTNLKDKNNQKDVVGTLAVQPLSWLTVGGSMMRGTGHAVAASAVNPNIAVGDNYTRNRWSAGVLIKTSPIEVRTEYLTGTDRQVKSHGYYLSTTAHLLRNFDFVASYDYFNKDRSSALTEQTNYMAGVQWWFYPKCRVQAQYTYCNPKQNNGYNVLQAQLQVRF